MIELAAGLPGGTATLTVQPHAGGPVRTVTAAYTAPVGSTVGVGGFGSPVEPRPEQIAEVRPGIFYVDLSRISDDDFNAAVDKLAAADGVVFDMRGYPWLAPEAAFKHLIDKPVTSNWFNIPIVTQPDRKGWDWRSTYWFWTPQAPRSGDPAPPSRSPHPRRCSRGPASKPRSMTPDTIDPWIQTKGGLSCRILSRRRPGDP